MFSWLEKDIPIAASVLFRGTWPCTKEGFYALRDRGIEVTDRETPENGMWAIKLRHPQWGEAVVMCLRDLPLPPAIMIDWDANLSEEEKTEFKAAGTAVSVMVNSRRNHLLRDRKNALFFIDAVMGEEGVGAVDHLSQRMWSRPALKAETAHNADADVQSLFTIHFVATGGPSEEKNGQEVDLLAENAEEKPETRWLHTHGLAEIGLFDFDILNPSDSALNPGVDVVRAVAYAILEGKLKQGGSAELFSNSGQIMAVPAKDFMTKAAPEWNEIRDDPSGEHVEDRVVLCEAPPNRWFGRIPSQIRPAKCLRENFPDDTMVYFSDSVSTLMAERARATYELFRQLRNEVGEFGDEIACLVKIGYPVDNSKKDEREHLWFQVHEAREKEVDATLMNQPFGIKRMKEGDRGVHSIEGMSDWQIMTPAGPINPRETEAVPQLRKAIEIMRTEGKDAA